MTLDETNLKVLSMSGSAEERIYASRILPIRRDSYLLLCTLLVANAIVTESLPILMDRCIGNGWQAIIISTFLLLIFAEILPQAFFTKFGLSAGAHFIWYDQRQHIDPLSPSLFPACHSFMNIGWSSVSYSYFGPLLFHFQNWSTVYWAIIMASSTREEVRRLQREYMVC